jgi:hypothetical protein
MPTALSAELAQFLAEFTAAATASLSAPAQAVAVADPASQSDPEPVGAQARAQRKTWTQEEETRLSALLIQRGGARFSEEQWQSLAASLGTDRTVSAVKQKAAHIRRAAAEAEEAGGLAVRADAVASGIHPGGVGPPRAVVLPRARGSAQLQSGIKQKGPRPSLARGAPRKVLASKFMKDQEEARRLASDWSAHSAGEEPVYEVTAILGLRQGWDDDGHDDNSYEYQVQWSGGEVTWEVVDNLWGCRDLVKSFLLAATKGLKLTVKGTSLNPAPVCYMFYYLSLVLTV